MREIAYHCEVCECVILLHNGTSLPYWLKVNFDHNFFGNYDTGNTQKGEIYLNQGQGQGQSRSRLNIENLRKLKF